MQYEEKGATIPVKYRPTFYHWVKRDGKLVGYVGKVGSQELL